MAFTPDGLHLVTFGTDEHVRLWSTTSGKNCLVNFGRLSNDSRKCVKLAVSAGTSQTMLFVPNYGDVEVYDIFSGLLVRTLRGHFNQVNCCLFLPHWQELYTAGNDRNILVWTPETSTITAYEDHLMESTKAKGERKRGSFVSRIAATADNWSSEED